MTKKELIEALSEYGDNVTVVICQNNFDFKSVALNDVERREVEMTDIDDRSLRWTEEVIILSD